MDGGGGASARVTVDESATTPQVRMQGLWYSISVSMARYVGMSSQKSVGTRPGSPETRRAMCTSRDSTPRTRL